MESSQRVREGRVSPGEEEKPLKFAKSLTCQAWCKCFTYRSLSMCLATLVGLGYHHFTHVR